MTTETVTHDQIVAKTPLLIMKTKTAQSNLGITEMPEVQIVSSDQPDMIKTRLTTTAPSRHAARWNIGQYSTQMIDSLEDGDTNKGYSIQFPSCNKEGDTASVTLKYPLIGQYGDRSVGAQVTYIVTHQEAVETPMWSSSQGEMDYRFTAIQISDSLYSGMDICNAKSIQTEVKFFYVDDGSSVVLGENSMFTIGSLNYYDEGRYESVSVKDSDTIKIQTPDPNDSLTRGNTKVSSSGGVSTAYGFRGDDWEDDIKHPNYYRQSTSIFQTGDSFRFSVQTAANTNSTGHNGNIWWSLSSASTAVPKPQEPTKIVDKVNAFVGESLTYTIDQKAHVEGMDVQGKYQSFAFYDILPAEIDYAVGSARMQRILTNGITTDITSSAGSFSYSEPDRTLTYTFNPAYLNTMIMDGETYRMTFSGTINETAIDQQDITNKVTVSINEYGQDATATTTPHLPQRPEKTVEGTEYELGQDITWTIKQTIAERGVTAGSDFVYSTLKLTDTLDTALSYTSLKVLDENGVDITTQAGSAELSGQEVFYTFNANYLKDTMSYTGETYTFLITTTVTEPPAGTTIIDNKASVTFNNRHTVTSDEEKVLVNTSGLSISKQADYEHRVDDKIVYTLNISNTTPGSIANDIVIIDDTLPSDMTISDVSITGIPEQIDYPALTNGTLTTEIRNNEVQYSASDNALQIVIPYLPYGTPALITYTVNADKQFNGCEIINTATATLSNPAPTAQDPIEDSALIWINSPFPSPLKSSDQTAKRIGDTIKYTIDVTNPHVGTVAHNVVIEDLFATDGIEIDRTSIVVYDTQGNIITDTTTIAQNRNTQGFTIETKRSLVNESNYTLYTPSAGPVEQSILNPLNETLEHVISVEFNAKLIDADLAGKDIINNVTTRCDEEDGGDDDETTRVNGPVLTIDKQVSTSQAKAGDVISYQLTVKQIRESLIAHNVVIEDIIDNEFACIVEDSVAVYNKDQEELKGCTVTFSDGIMTVETNQDLDDTESLTITYDVSLLKASGSEKIINTAGSWADNADKVIDKELVVAKKSDLLKPAEIEVNKTADPETGSRVSPSDTITYSLAFANEGETSAKDIAVFDTIPNSTSFVSVENTHNAVYLEEQAALAWNIKELEPGATVMLSFKVKVNEETPANYEIKNMASYDQGTPGTPSDHLPNQSNETTHVTPDLGPAQVIARKTSDPESGSLIKAGDTITYSLTFSNIGEQTAYNIAVYDAIPKYTTFTSLKDEHDGIYLSEQNAVAWSIGSLTAGETVELGFTVTVNDTIPKDTIVYNMASFALDTPEAPVEPLLNSTNPTEHPTSTTDTEKYQSKGKLTPKTEDTSEGIKAVLATIVILSALLAGKIYLTYLHSSIGRRRNRVE